MSSATDDWNIFSAASDEAAVGLPAAGDDFIFSDEVEAPVFDNHTMATTTTSLSPSTLSDDQEKVLSMLLCFSAFLSIIGSSSIVFKIIKIRHFKNPYQRTMLALSSSDVLASITLASFPFLMPEGQRIWSLGNQATCSALGFMTQLTFMAAGCNCILSFYFLLTVRYSIRRDKFAERFEKPMHIINLSYFSITAIVGLVEGFYSPVDIGFGCWVNDWPIGCDEDGDGCWSPLIGMSFAGLPFLFFLGSIFVNNVMIYRHVRSIFLRKRKSNNKDAARTTSKDQSTIRTLVARRKEATKKNDHDFMQQQAAIQGFLYVASFLFCYIPASILRFLEAVSYGYNDANIYGLLLLTAATLPLQGFFNMLIYHRPTYLRIKQNKTQVCNNDWTAYQALCTAFSVVFCTALARGEDEGETTRSSRTSTSSGSSRNSRGSYQQWKNNSFSKFSSNLDVVLEEGSEFYSNRLEECKETELTSPAPPTATTFQITTSTRATTMTACNIRRLSVEQNSEQNLEHVATGEEAKD